MWLWANSFLSSESQCLYPLNEDEYYLLCRSHYADLMRQSRNIWYRGGRLVTNVTCHRGIYPCITMSFNLLGSSLFKGPQGLKTSLTSFPCSSSSSFSILGALIWKIRTNPCRPHGAKNFWERVQPHQATGSRQPGNQSFSSFSLKTCWSYTAAQCGTLWVEEFIIASACPVIWKCWASGPAGFSLWGFGPELWAVISVWT